MYIEYIIHYKCYDVELDTRDTFFVLDDCYDVIDSYNPDEWYIYGVVEGGYEELIESHNSNNNELVLL